MTWNINKSMLDCQKSGCEKSNKKINIFKLIYKSETCFQFLQLTLN